MNLLVYEMPSIKNLRGEDRSWVTNLSRKLQEKKAHLGFVPLFEALGGGYFKKRKDKQRLVAYRMDVPTAYGLAPVVILLELFARNDSRYEDGKAEKLSLRFASLLEAHRSKIARWAEQELGQRGERNPLQLPKLPESLSVLLNPIPFDKKGTGFFHSLAWNDLFRKASAYHKSQLYEGLCKIVHTPHEAWQADELRHRDVRIRFATLPDPESNSLHFYLLGFTLSSWSAGDRETVEHKVNEEWQKFRDQVLVPLRQIVAEFGTAPHSDRLQRFIDCVSRFSSCAYPDYLLLDFELWEKLTTTESMLLPLSYEELTTLERLFSGERFPAIIEGRAGSGKTTLLCYYVPERLVHLPSGAESSSERPRLLYLAENPKLLKNAQEIIGKLREKLQAEYAVGSSRLQEEFHTFHSFAVGQLPPQRRGRFWDASDGRIDFVRFRSLLRDSRRGLRARLSRQVQNPEILWFVIRSYIKGFNLNDEGEERWMSPEQFAVEEELGRRDRQVSQEVYAEVWEKVWPWYKRLTVPCDDNDFQPPCWDHLDLAWEVLDHRWVHAPSYAVLICDEVQDLTRVELAAMFQSSDFLQYDREPAQAGRVPIILAGDSYQTINPACFRWARVKADCAKALVQQIPHAPLPRIEPFQLLYNYRNRPSIARLCNALQLLRQEVVGVQAELQRIWQPEDAPLNQAVRQLRITPEGTLLKHLFDRGVAFLGPEPAQVDQDDAAAAFWQALGLPHGPPRTFATRSDLPDASAAPPSPEESAKTLNYECPADVKGLEKPFYALLGFGTAFAQLGLTRFWDWNESARETEIPESQLLAAEYFLNRLYVAASRAREQLWIVETEEGWNAFWKPLEAWIRKKHHSPDSACGATESLLAPFGFSWSPGSPEELIGVFQNEWPRMARDYEEQAEALRNAEFAERAAYYYRLTDDTRREQRAWALKEYLEGRLVEAVHRLRPIDRDKALQWAWEAAAWDELAHADFASTWQHNVACLMQVPPPQRSSAWIAAVAQHLDRHHERIADDLAHIRKSWQTWSLVITELLEQAAHDAVDDASRRAAQHVGQQWQNATHRDPDRFYRALGQIEYQAGCFPQAVELWEKIRHTQHRDYFLAKAEVTPYPGKLQYLESAGQWEEMLRQQAMHRDTLASQDCRRILRACRELGRWPQALQTALALENQDFVDLWRHLVDQPTVSTADLHRYLREAHHLCQQTSDGSSQLDSDRSWALLMLDCLLAFQAKRGQRTAGESSKTASSLPPSEQDDRLYEPLFAGLTLDRNLQRLVGHLQRVWEGRQDRPARWEAHQSWLQWIGPYGYSRAQHYWNQDQPQEAAACAHLLCRLLWRTVDRREDAELRRWFDQVVVCPYAAVESAPLPPGSAASDLDPLVTLLGVDPSLAELARYALRSVAEAPARLFRDLQDTSWRELHDLLEGLAYLMYHKVQDLLATAPEPLVCKTADELLLLGRFVQQVRFRKLAVKYYERLVQASEQISFPPDFLDAAQAGLDQAQRALEEFREQRAALRDQTFIRRGERGESATLVVRSLPARPEIILELLPDSYQARFKLDETRSTADLWAIPPVHVQQPRGHAPEWKLTAPEGQEYRLTWLKEDRKLRIDAPDRVFLVEL